jgi:hypothetical protein
MHKAYVEAVRERIKLARSVTPRPSDDLREEERTVLFRRIMTKLTKNSPDRRNYITNELLRRLFDLDKMMYYVAPDWWMNEKPINPTQSTISDNVKRMILEVVGIARSLPDPVKWIVTAHLGTYGSGNSTNPDILMRDIDSLLAGLDAQFPFDMLPALVDLKAKIEAIKTVMTNDSLNKTLTDKDSFGWDGNKEMGHDHYLITEESRPAPLGASLGWLLQLDGDDHRNAIINAPWAKVVIPIRRGMEKAAIKWLKKAEVEDKVEDNNGFDLPFEGEKFGSLKKINDRRPTIYEAIMEMVKEMDEENKQSDIDETEKVFQYGVDPMQDGFKWPVDEKNRFPLFSQWTVILPTDQVIAKEFEVT